MFGQRGRMTTRLMALGAIFLIATAALTARVAYIQIVDADRYKSEARNEHFGQQ